MKEYEFSEIAVL